MKTELLKMINEIYQGDDLPLVDLSHSEEILLNYIKAVKANLDGDALYFERVLTEMKGSNDFLYTLLVIRKIWKTEGYEKSLKLFDEYRSLADGVDSYFELEFNLLYGVTLINLEEYQRAINSLKKVINIASENNFYERLGRAYYNILICYEEIGDQYNVEITLSQMEKFCQTYDLSDIDLLLAKTKGFQCFERGSYREGSEVLTQAIEKSSINKWSDDLLNLRKILAYIQLRMGDFQQFEENLNQMNDLIRVRQDSPWENAILLLRLEYYIKTFQIYKANDLSTVLNKIELGRSTIFFEQFKLKLYNISGQWPSGDKSKGLKAIRKIASTNYFYEDGFKEDLLHYRFALGEKIQIADINDLIAENEKKRRVFNNFRLKLLKCFISIIDQKYDEVTSQLRELCGYLRGTGQKYEYFSMLYILKEHLEFNYGKNISLKEKSELKNLSGVYGASYKAIFRIFPFSFLKMETLDGRFEFNFINRHIKREGQIIYRGKSRNYDWKLLEELFKFRGQTVSNAEIVKILGDEIYNPEIHHQRIYQYIVNIRKIFIQARIAPQCLRNIAGEGYQLSISEDQKQRKKLDAFNDLLGTFSKSDKIFTKDISKKLNLPMRAVQRKMNKLLDSGAVEAIGKSRGRYYIKKE